MNLKKNKTELLSPGGSKEAVYAAVAAGCDAVYLGGKNYSARSSAANFDDNELQTIIEFCHLRGVKVFVTINTLYKDCELYDVFEFANHAYAIGADALIIQDLGCFCYLRKHLGDKIEFHASTQMTAHSLSDVLFLENMGFDRVVLSRELSLSEISFISENSKAELEVFVHGALCYSFSGACLMSSFYGGRSGNRGNCAQPCRLKYSVDCENGEFLNKHLLSPKDIESLDQIKKLRQIGVKSIKIEGRLKSPEYVYVVTDAYRRAMDGNCDLSELKTRCAAMFNRGGFTNSYLLGNSGLETMSVDSVKPQGVEIGEVLGFHSNDAKFITDVELFPGDGILIVSKFGNTGAAISKHYEKGAIASVSLTATVREGDRVFRSFDKILNDEAARLGSNDSRKIQIQAEYSLEPESPIKMSAVYTNLWGAEISCFANSAELVERAQKSPLSPDRVADALSKTGGYPFDFVFNNTKVSGDCFIGISALNSVRRSICDSLKQDILNSYKREAAKSPEIEISVESEPVFGKKKISVLVHTEAQLNAAIREGISRIYCTVYNGFLESANQIAERCKENSIELYAALGKIDRGNVEKLVSALEKTDISGFLVRSLGQISMIHNKKIAVDFSLNVANYEGYQFVSNYAETIMPSLELNVRDLGFCDTNTELLAYGKITVMTTALCPVGNFNGKKHGHFCSLKGRHESFYIKDRKGVKLAVLTDCDSCTASIMSDRPVFMLTKLDKLTAERIRIDLTDENSRLSGKILDFAIDAVNGIVSDETELVKDGISYGHYFKGI